MDHETQAFLNELEKRLSVLEGGESDSNQPESAGERMRRERQERIDAKREARPETDEHRMGSPRPTSRQRKEELSRRSSTNLPGPQMSPSRPPQAPKLGGAIGIVVVDNGEFKTGNFYIDGALEAVLP